MKQELDCFVDCAPRNDGRVALSVMPCLVLGTDVLRTHRQDKTWMAGSSPAVTSVDALPEAGIARGRIGIFLHFRTAANCFNPKIVVAGSLPLREDALDIK